MANSCNVKLSKDFLIAKPHEMSFQLMSTYSSPQDEAERSSKDKLKLILIKTESIIDPKD